MNNKIKTILMAAIMSSVVLTQGVCVSAAQFDDGASAFSDGTGSVSALASTLAKQTEEQTQEFVAKEEEAAQIREERRVEKAEKASEKAEQEKTAVLESIQQTVEDTKKKIAEEAEAKGLEIVCAEAFTSDNKTDFKTQLQKRNVWQRDRKW
mgnify:CR=1 FL=1